MSERLLTNVFWLWCCVRGGILMEWSKHVDADIKLRESQTDRKLISPGGVCDQIE
jgi:hypothetical protein